MGTGWIRLWRWTAWGGIGLSLYAGWLTVDDARDRASSEREISTACDRLVSPAEVMDLRGGMIRATASTYDADRIDTHKLSSSCTIYKVPGPGQTVGLFTLSVRGSSASEPLNKIYNDILGDPFYDLDAGGRNAKRDITAVADRRPEPQPLGVGTLGWYNNWYTMVRAECGPGSRATAPRLLHVMARADYEDVSAADRRRLARIARSATERLASRIGCRTRLPALPDGSLPEAPSALRPARAAGGSCGWFARRFAGRAQVQGKPLPDRVLEVPTRSANPVEGCLLAVSPEPMRQAISRLPEKKRELVRSDLTHWWVRTVSYFGSEAAAVGFRDLGKDQFIKPGTVGHNRTLWWASSVCAGQPAVHTVFSDFTYADSLDPQTRSDLFHAYVDDITKRRGCTHVKYPAMKDFQDLDTF
ncbi:hypothetical protein [Streptomyces griseosporeus]|uniref:hypothetical protein n=1 Tax=Streptomyces griseosporeus TaxID=1910 RepID=UPI0036F4EC50